MREGMMNWSAGRVQQTKRQLKWIVGVVHDTTARTVVVFESDWAARRERTEKLGSKIDNLLIGAEHRARRVGRGRSGSELPPSGHSRSSALLHPSPSVRPSASFDPPSPLPSRPLGLPAVLDDEDSRVRSGGNCSVAASTSRTRDRSATDPRRSSHWP